jgi:hypothetical protein
MLNPATTFARPGCPPRKRSDTHCLFLFSTPIHLSSVLLNPPLDPPQRPPTHSLIRLIRLHTKFKLIDLQSTKRRARKQRKRDLRRACEARVSVTARERALERRGAARRRDGAGSAGGRRGGRGEGPAQHAST